MAALSNPQTWNRYAYVAGDPVNFVDPGGMLMSPVEEFMACITTPVGGSWGWLCAGGAYGWSWGPSCGPQDEVGGGTPRTPRSRTELLRNTVAWLTGKLQDEDCAKAIGASSTQKAQSKLRRTKIAFKDLGPLRVRGDADKGFKFDPSSPPVGRYVRLLLYERIQWNTKVNWLDPNRTRAVNMHGQSVTYPLLDAQAAALGVGNVSPAQFMGLTILHELAHAFGLDHPKTGPATRFNRHIWKECF